jgi:hypothetical protein
LRVARGDAGDRGKRPEHTGSNDLVFEPGHWSGPNPRAKGRYRVFAEVRAITVDTTAIRIELEPGAEVEIHWIADGEPTRSASMASPFAPSRAAASL